MTMSKPQHTTMIDQDGRLTAEGHKWWTKVISDLREIRVELESTFNDDERSHLRKILANEGYGLLEYYEADLIQRTIRDACNRLLDGILRQDDVTRAALIDRIESICTKSLEEVRLTLGQG